MKSHYKSKPKRSVANVNALPLAVKSYDAFLDVTNPYHVLLSQKIAVSRSSQSTLPEDLKSENALRDYESQHSLSYINEVGTIIKNGNFENHIKEESFLIDEYSEINSDEIINIMESKLNRLIQKLNSDQNIDDKYFKFILTTYIEKIRAAEIDESERRILINRITTSRKLQKIIKEYWDNPQVTQPI